MGADQIIQEVRINELARELEIKAKRLTEFLQSLGRSVGHSSLVGTDDADAARRHFRSLGESRNNTHPNPTAVPSEPKASLVSAEPTRAQLLQRIAMLEAQLGISRQVDLLTRCPKCGVQVRTGRLSSHISKRCPKAARYVESASLLRARSSESKHRKRGSGHRKGRKGRGAPRTCQGGLPSLGKRR
jgi:hypothetical protein